MLRGDRLGYMFAGQPYDRIPGQWGGIRLTHTSYDNHINFADIHSGNFGIRVDSADISRNKLLLENSIVHNTTHHALDIYMAQVKVGNSQITNAGGDCLHVRGGDVSLTHCTIARFFRVYWGQGTAINFANYEGSTRLPLQNPTLQNCIVTGYRATKSWEALIRIIKRMRLTMHSKTAWSTRLRWRTARGRTRLSAASGTLTERIRQRLMTVRTSCVKRILPRTKS